MQQVFKLALTVILLSNLINPIVAQCELFNIETEVSDCNDDGNYTILFDFSFEAVADSGFNIHINGKDYGTGLYQELPFKLDNFNSPKRVNKLVICDTADDSCCIETVFESPCPCELDCINARIVECDEDQESYYVRFTGAPNSASDSFELELNGVLIGYLAYDSLPFNSGPFNFNHGELYYSLQDQEIQDCSRVIITPKLESCPNCEMGRIEGKVTECNEMNEFYFEFNFEYINNQSDYFSVAGNGNDYGMFLYGKGPYKIGPLRGDCESFYEFIVFDNDNDACHSVFEFDSPICCDDEACKIGEIELDPIECTGEGTYSLWLNFEYQNVTNDFFDVYANDTHLGYYAYEDLPIIIEYFPERDGDYDIITICDNDNRECCKSHEFMGLDCSENEGDCRIKEVFSERHECNDDNLFYVDVVFDYSGMVSDHFIIRGNGELYGTFEYGKDFYTIGPLEGDCETIYEFVVIDVQNEDCRGAVEFEKPVCCEDEGNCKIYEIQLEPVECTGKGTYSLWLNFEYEGVTNDFFDVWANDEFLGYFAYADLPVFIENFPERDVAYDIITICDNDNHECCKTHEFMGLDCSENEGDCRIKEVFAERHECNDDNLFYVDVVFDYSGMVSDHFIIRGNGELYGTFEYGKGFYTIGPLEGDCETIYEFVVIDVQNEDCRGAVEFEKPVCCEDEGNCKIYEIQLEPVECTGKGTYSLWLNFEYEGVTNDFFDVWANDEFLGYFAYADLPVFIENFPERDVAYDIITICDNDNHECCKTHEFMGLDCSENEGDCRIKEVFAERHECNDDNLFYVDVVFDYSGMVSDHFIIRGNGELYGTFEYGKDFYTIGPLEGDCETIYEFVVIDVQNEDCRGAVEFEKPVCCEDEGNCKIYEIQLEPVECTGKGTYSLWLNFEYEGVSGDYFDVLVRGNIVGHFAYADLPVFIENFPEREVEYDIITICDTDNALCCKTLEFMGLNCTEEDNECDIRALYTEPHACNDDHLFYVDLEFEYSGMVSDQFSIRGNGVEYGSFEYGETFYTIGPLVGDCETIYEFVIIDANNEDCRDAFWFEEAICCEEENEECSIEIDFTGFFELDGDVAFVEIDLFYEGTGNLGFDAFLNEEFIGFYLYEELPVLLEIPLNELNDLVSLKVCDNDSDCCTEFQIDLTNPIICEIFEVEYEIIDCENEMFYLEIDLNQISTVSDSFNLIGNGMNHGNFSYNELPVIIGPFSTDENREWELLAQDLEIDACSEFVEIGKVDCSTLSIDDESQELILVTQISSQLKIASPVEKLLQIDIYDYSGQKLISNSSPEENEVYLDISNLRTGIYVVHVMSENHSFAQLIPITISH